MFQPVSKYPYVANATTSKNDSAVSSSFSASDTNSGVNFGASYHRQHASHEAAGKPIPEKPNSECILISRALREEHRRVNPIIGNYFQVKFLFKYFLETLLNKKFFSVLKYLLQIMQI